MPLAQDEEWLAEQFDKAGGRDDGDGGGIITDGGRRRRHGVQPDDGGGGGDDAPDGHAQPDEIVQTPPRAACTSPCCLVCRNMNCATRVFVVVVNVVVVDVGVVADARPTKGLAREEENSDVE
jgi:hypothetical protein